MARAKLLRLRAEERRQSTESLGLIDWVEQGWPEFDRFDYLGPYAEVLEEAAEVGGVRTVFAAPPQHGKTELTLRTFLWWDARYGGRRHAYVTYNADRALSVARAFWTLAELAGFEPSGTYEEIRLRGGSTVKFTSIGGSLTGYPIDGVCVVDDPIKGPIEAASPTYRRQRVEWFDKVAFSRRHAHTSYIVMATRWHVEDLSGVLIKRGWRYVNLKAIAEGEVGPNGRVIDDPLNRRPGESLWKRKPPEFFDEDRADLFAWYALYQGEPRPAGGQVFREPGFYEELPKRAYRVAFGVDLAYTAKTRADWSVLLELWRQDQKNKPLFFIVAVHRSQKEAPAFTETTLKAHRKPGRPMRWYASGTEKGSADFIKKLGVPLQVLPPRGDKLVRAQPVAAAWNDARVLVPNTEFIHAPWVPAFLDEVLNFTGISDLHDDQVDALGAAYDALNAPKLKLHGDHESDLPGFRM